MRNRPIGQEGGEAGAVLGDVRTEVVLEPVLDPGPEHDPDRADTEQSQEDPPPDGRANRLSIHHPPEYGSTPTPGCRGRGPPGVGVGAGFGVLGTENRE